MYQLKSTISRCVRSASIPAAFLCVVVSGCADQQTTGPQLKPTTVRSQQAVALEDVPFEKFFLAWSQGHYNNPISTQTFALDVRQNRQYANLWADQAVQSFATSYPGRLYIVGDEPDQWCIPAYEYAGIYRAFIDQMRVTDPTARFSPAGFAEPNDRCCPPEDNECKQRMHGIGYAQQFYDAYIQRYGAPPRVDEWRFHDFGIAFATGDMEGWWARVDAAASWSVAHGANMVLGAWAFHGWRGPVSQYQEHMKQAMGRLINDNRIIGAVYWSYEPWIESPYPLVTSDGSLTAEGQTYANPLTDVPVAPRIVGSADGTASLRWNNTTAAWGTEVEFWVQSPGSSSFEYQRTERVAAAGSVQSPFVSFKPGDRVKARARYYNVYGQAEWTPFSKAVMLSTPEAEANDKRLSRKRPLFCFLRLC